MHCSSSFWYWWRKEIFFHYSVHCMIAISQWMDRLIYQVGRQRCGPLFSPSSVELWLSTVADNLPLFSDRSLTQIWGNPRRGTRRRTDGWLAAWIGRFLANITTTRHDCREWLDRRQQKTKPFRENPSLPSPPFFPRKSAAAQELSPLESSIVL